MKQIVLTFLVILALTFCSCEERPEYGKPSPKKVHGTLTAVEVGHWSYMVKESKWGNPEWGKQGLLFVTLLVKNVGWKTDSIPDNYYLIDELGRAYERHDFAYKFRLHPGTGSEVCVSFAVPRNRVYLLKVFDDDLFPTESALIKLEIETDQQRQEREQRERQEQEQQQLKWQREKEQREREWQQQLQRRRGGEREQPPLQLSPSLKSR